MSTPIPIVPRTPDVPVSPDTYETGGDAGFWYELIDERPSGDFLGLTHRTMQAYRQRGGGPRYIVISSRCIRYRRIDLKAWADARTRSSTADTGTSP